MNLALTHIKNISEYKIEFTFDKERPDLAAHRFKNEFNNAKIRKQFDGSYKVELTIPVEMLYKVLDFLYYQTDNVNIRLLTQ